MDTFYSLKNKKVLLTGAAGDIGIALSRGFLSAGSIVIGTMRQLEPDWHGLNTEFADTFFPTLCDLSDDESIKKLMTEVNGHFQNCPDIIVHNAWTCPSEAPYSLVNLRKTSAVGLEAAYILYGHYAPLMAKRGSGTIISVVSINGNLAFPANPAYTSIKAALGLFTKTIARDFGEYGVRANNLCPGYVRTKMTAGSYADPIKNEERRSRTMLGRWAEPEDMVGPCLFLASAASSYITGTDLFVDGGWITKGL